MAADHWPIAKVSTKRWQMVFEMCVFIKMPGKQMDQNGLESHDLLQIFWSRLGLFWLPNDFVNQILMSIFGNQQNASKLFGNRLNVNTIDDRLQKIDSFLQITYLIRRFAWKRTTTTFSQLGSYDQVSHEMTWHFSAIDFNEIDRQIHDWSSRWLVFKRTNQNGEWLANKFVRLVYVSKWLDTLVKSKGSIISVLSLSLQIRPD